MSENPSGTPPLKALICEDEGMIVMQLRNALRVAGYDVAAEATDGLEAVRLARESKPDFILMDIKMPNMDGITAAREILAERRVPIIMLTAFGDEHSVHEAMETGACAYLVKPVTKEQLIPAVQAGMAQFGSLEQAKSEKSSLKKALKETIARQTAASTQATKDALRSPLPGSPLGARSANGTQEGAAASEPGHGTVAADDELLALTRRLLASIHSGDVKTYRELSAPELTAFETDVAPYRIEGVEFHADLMTAMQKQRTYENLIRCDMLSPRVQRYGDTAIVTYTRLMTYAGPAPAFRAFNETRVFARQGGAWRMVHFHRSHAAD